MEQQKWREKNTHKHFYITKQKEKNNQENIFYEKYVTISAEKKMRDNQWDKFEICFYHFSWNFSIYVIYEKKKIIKHFLFTMKLSRTSLQLDQ